MSGALNSDALGCNWILSLPPVPLSTSLANCCRFSVWKLLTGYALGRSQRVCAAAGRVNASATATAASAWVRRFIASLLSVAGGVGRDVGPGGRIDVISIGFGGVTPIMQASSIASR